MSLNVARRLWDLPQVQISCLFTMGSLPFYHSVFNVKALDGTTLEGSVGALPIQWFSNLQETLFAALVWTVEPERDRGTVGADLSHFVRPGVFERGDRVIISTFGGHTCHPTSSWSPKYHLIWPHVSWHHYLHLLTILICCFFVNFLQTPLLYDISSIFKEILLYSILNPT